MITFSTKRVYICPQAAPYNFYIARVGLPSAFTPQFQTDTHQQHRASSRPDKQVFEHKDWGLRQLSPLRAAARQQDWRSDYR